MKKFLVLAALAVSACGALDELLGESQDISFAGMNYNHGSGEFSGESVTPIANMPTTGSSVYLGEYTYDTAKLGTNVKKVGDGSARLTANFGAATASLSLSGDLDGTVSGVISGNRIERPNLTSLNGLEGQFYGDSADKVAGEFSARNQNFEAVTGHYIVSK